MSVKLTLQSQSLKIQDLRRQYYEAAHSMEAAEELLATLESVKSTAPIQIGYKAVAQLMICSHSFNPFTKLKYFYSGRDLLESAISSESTNVELRFLRYAVQSNVPALLNYSSKLSEDRQALLQFVLSRSNQVSDADLYDRIKNYLRDSASCSQEEKDQLKRMQ